MGTGLFLFLSCSISQAQHKLGVHRDTVSLSGVEMVIQNATQNVKGFLFNSKNGKTDFKTIGSALQFTVGAAGFPQAGDSTYTNLLLKGQYVKVWRNGRLSCLSCPDSSSIDTATGKIIFRPSLAPSEKIYIEAYRSIDFVYRHWKINNRQIFAFEHPVE